MHSPPAEIGARGDDIDTPALIVDLDAFERNLAKMAKVAESAGVRLRPHAKTHKCPEIAKRQIAMGAIGQCVQKVGEAEALASAGIRDILVSNEIVGEAKLRRLARLAETARIALCFDAVEQVEATSRIAREHGVELGGLVEIEVGMERCGVPAGRAGPRPRTPDSGGAEPALRRLASLSRPRPASRHRRRAPEGDRRRHRKQSEQRWTRWRLTGSPAQA